jgi:hypothetical protein
MLNRRHILIVFVKVFFSLCRTRCQAVDSMSSKTIRVSSYASKADDGVGSLTAGSLAQLEAIEACTVVNHGSQKEATSERSVSTSSSSGIVSDDMLSASPSPNKRRPKIVLFSPDQEYDTQPDAPTGVCVTEEDGLLVVQWNPVSLQDHQTNKCSAVIGYKVYANGKLEAKARGPCSRQAVLTGSHLTREDPIVVTVKAQGITCDSVPSDAYWHTPRNSLPPSDHYMLKSNSKDSFYSTGQSCHTSLSRESASAVVVSQSTKDFQSLQLCKSAINQTSAMSMSSATAKLTDLLQADDRVFTCHQLVRPALTDGQPCLETSV